MVKMNIVIYLHPISQFVRHVKKDMFLQTNVLFITLKVVNITKKTNVFRVSQQWEFNIQFYTVKTHQSIR